MIKAPSIQTDLATKSVRLALKNTVCSGALNPESILPSSKDQIMEGTKSARDKRQRVERAYSFHVSQPISDSQTSDAIQAAPPHREPSYEFPDPEPRNPRYRAPPPLHPNDDYIEPGTHPRERTFDDVNRHQTWSPPGNGNGNDDGYAREDYQEEQVEYEEARAVSHANVSLYHEFNFSTRNLLDC